MRFEQTLRALLADGHHNFLEVHPTQVLLRPIQEVMSLTQVDGVVCGSLQRDTDGAAVLLRSLASLYVHGAAVQWEGVYSAGGHHVTLPPIPWQRKRYWLSAAEGSPAQPRRAPMQTAGGHPLLGVHLQNAAQPATHIFETELGVDRPHYLTDHRVDGVAILPAAAYVEMALALTKELRPTENFALAKMTFDKACIVPEQRRDHGLEYGPAFQGIGQIWCSGLIIDGAGVASRRATVALRGARALSFRAPDAPDGGSTFRRCSRAAPY
ncbi:MAG: polyketide synthase dehydratase domain-containing protein [Anaerolineales bacterium]|nr:polyketide synthase dehydratase domain-containing protein [Anaerolineales bacterium]